MPRTPYNDVRRPGQPKHSDATTRCPTSAGLAALHLVRIWSGSVDAFHEGFTSLDPSGREAEDLLYG